ncbi:MAG: polymer-forming cytoskeletal protein [Parasphingopyxis sp.]|nr:polymer-forming cytoskeletal protein [Sphingomonadales bacterium]
MPSSAASSSTFSVIGTDVRVSGDIDAKVDLHVDGEVEGDIRCGVLVQGDNSRIKGAVSAEQARIAGTVEGAITANELIIESSARVMGDVTYEKLSVATGGHVEGHFRYKTAGTLKKEEPQAGRREAKAEETKPLPRHEPEAAAKDGGQAAII